MNLRPWRWSAVILVSGAALGVLAVLDVEGSVRGVLALWFLCVCPGMAFVRLMRLRDAWAEWTCAVALSLALDALMAQTMLYAGAWSPPVGLAILLALSLLGASLQLTQAQRPGDGTRKPGCAEGRLREHKRLEPPAAGRPA